jgi:sugar phosphate isomerase/epimerase
MKFGICNELFEKWPFEKVCRYVKSVGYDGLELAPFTLAENAVELSAEKRKELRKIAGDHGVALFGLHWLMVSPKGLHITVEDAAVRRKSADFLCGLINLCADLGGNIMVFGSPNQRNIAQGQSYGVAWRNARDVFAGILDTLAERKVTLCLEPLTSAETNIFRSSHEAAHMVREFGHPYFKLHLDVKAMSAEGRPIPEIIGQHAPDMRHFHANDPNKRGPGFGAVDFAPIFAALKDVRYDGWVSVEVFDYSPDPETIAAKSIEYMKTFV